MKLEGKVAIVAGGGQGIGEGIVHCLAEEGADVAVVDVNGATAASVARQVSTMGRKSLAVTADLTDDKQVDRAVREALDCFGKLDILVNNVGGVSEDTSRVMAEYAATVPGITTLPPHMVYGPEVWDRFYKLNLKTHVMMSHAVTPHFVKQRSGRIVNVSSVAGRLPDPGQMPYSAMKAGDISITWSLARALAPYNVTVNCICPGFVYTPLWARGATAQYNAIREAKAAGRQLPDRFRRFTTENIEGLTPRDFWLKYIVIPSTPLGRDQTAEDMGRAVVFFASDDASNITGQVLHVDGGMVMR